ncbi:MAG: maleylpyruvate isomerase family mycothiol-dependent enzyme [Acidimicrobiia bacterium]
MEPDELLEAGGRALDASVHRLATAIRPLTELNQALPGSTWTAREAIAHLVTAMDLYTEIATGTPSPVTEFSTASFEDDNRRRIADVSETDAAKLAYLLEDATARFLSALRGQAGNQTVTWHAGMQVDLATLVALMLGEVVLHGYDVATAYQQPWPLGIGDVALVLGAYAPCYERCVNTERTRGLTVAYEIEVRGVARFVVRFDDGRYSLTLPGPEPVDCTISADPVAFLLVGSGRLERWPAIALGLVEAGGSRPEMALEFNDLFIFP